MEEGLKRLELIKKNRYVYKDRNAVIVDRLEQYAKGEIDATELLSGLVPEEKAKVYLALNSMLDYKEKEVRYYIPKPMDPYLNYSECPAISAGVPWIILSGPVALQEDLVWSMWTLKQKNVFPNPPTLATLH